MVNEFIEEIINASHMRLLSPDWEIVKNGYDILDTIGTRVHNKTVKEKIKSETKKVMDGYNQRLPEIEKEQDNIKKNKKRYMLEFDRLKHMVEFYSELIHDHPSFF